ncbi:MAG: acetylornithine deacetylase [Paracoccaceae bacterium]|nr:acetylornithine deacetylase [Paracoccaceae bacterium]MDG2258014.1 acetylornithine deacetylase [Paracoccaceae bacterium]
MEQTLEILDRLIAFDTVSSKSNLAIIDFIENFLIARGFDVTRIPDETGQKAGIYAVLGPKEASGIMLSAHTDVVPVEGQLWTSDPFKLTRLDDRLYGRGTTDMKGYVASVMALADRASKLVLKEPLKIVLSYDEEIGCVGIKQMIDRLTPLIGLPRACIVGEPTEMQVAVGHKGKAALRATCKGQAGHSALAPKFTNALHIAAEFVQELQALQTELAQNGARDLAYDIPYSTVHVGQMSGGTALNIVPDAAEITFECRHLVADRPEELEERIADAAERVADRHRLLFDGADISIEKYNSYPGLDVASDASIVNIAQRLAATNETTKVAFGTEAGYFDALGVQTVVCGPGSMEGQGHKADEYIEVSQLNACDEMMDRILAELQG